MMYALYGNNKKVCFWLRSDSYTDSIILRNRKAPAFFISRIRPADRQAQKHRGLCKTMSGNRRQFVRFCILQMTYWGYYGSLPAMLSAYFLENGLSDSALSRLMMIAMGACFLGSLFWGRLCDRYQTNKKVFLAAMSAAVAMGIITYLNAAPAALLFVLFPLYEFLCVPLYSILDAWVIRAYPDWPGAYGYSRVWATVWYAVSCLAAGQLADKIGYGTLLIYSSTMAAVLLAAALSLPDPKPLLYEQKAAAAGEKAGLAALLRIRPFVYFLLFLFFFGAACAPITHMKIVFLNGVGGDVGWLGIDSFIGSLILTPMFGFAGRFKSVPVSVRLLICSAGGVLMILCNVFASSPWHVIAGTFCYMGVYGILVPAIRDHIDNIVPKILQNTAYSLADAVLATVSGMLAMLYTGPLLAAAGTHGTALLCLAVILVPLLMAIRMLWEEKKRAR